MNTLLGFASAIINKINKYLEDMDTKLVHIAISKINLLILPNLLN